jgi:hypothetical protein
MTKLTYVRALVACAAIMDFGLTIYLYMQTNKLQYELADLSEASRQCSVGEYSKGLRLCELACYGRVSSFNTQSFTCTCLGANSVSE